MPTNENGLVQSIKSAVLRRYPNDWFFKVAGSPGQMTGVPDILICHQGHLVAFEAKFQRPGESEAHARDRASLRQRVELSKLYRAGATAAVVLTAEEALAILDSIDEDWCGRGTVVTPNTEGGAGDEG